MLTKKNEMILGVSGEEGSFSEEAALLYLQQTQLRASLQFLLDMEGVLAAISLNRIDMAILPVVNSRGGLVTMAFEAMGKYSFTFIDQISLHIQQCLMVLPGTTRSQITKIVSHPQGIAQCSNFLKKEFPQAEKIDWQDTALAARDLATGKLDSSNAVIAASRAAQIYGLEILEKNIQDTQPNLTTFIIVKPRS